MNLDLQLICKYEEEILNLQKSMKNTLKEMKLKDKFINDLQK